MMLMRRRRYAEHWARVREGRKNECRRLLQLGIWPIRVEPLNVPDQYTRTKAPNYLSEIEEMVHRNIKPQRLKALHGGTQCPVPCGVFVVIANSYDPTIGKLPHKFLD